MNDNPFPSIHKTIDSFIQDEEGSIPHGKLVALGAFFMIMSTYLGVSAFDHVSHTSHKSHSSHRSHSSGSHSSGHSNHSSHSSHSSHSNHSNHASHANYTPVPHSSHGSHSSNSKTNTHSNSNYSSAGDLNVVAAPAASVIKGIGNIFKFAENMPDLDSDVPVNIAETRLGTVKSATVPKTLMDIAKPTLQTPNESLSVSAMTPLIQSVPGSHQINPADEGGLP